MPIISGEGTWDPEATFALGAFARADNFQFVVLLGQAGGSQGQGGQSNRSSTSSGKDDGPKDYREDVLNTEGGTTPKERRKWPLRLRTQAGPRLRFVASSVCAGYL